MYTLLRGFSLTILIIFLLEFESFAKEDVLVVEYKTKVEVLGKTIKESETITLQINSADALDYADVRLTYNSKLEKFKLKEASITDLEGNIIRKIKNKEISERSSGSTSSTFHSDRMIQSLDFRWTEFPYRLTYTYERTSNQFMFVAYWLPIMFDDVQHLNYSLEVDLSENYPVNIKSQGELEYSAQKLDGRITHLWKSKEAFEYKYQKYSPHTRSISPGVFVVPENLFFDIEARQSTWTEYGDWIYNLNRGLDELTDEDLYQVKKLTQGIDDPREKIRVLYHYMQDRTRYINIPLGTGGMKPYPAKYVCENKYGDCKALTIYMQALLKAAGIKSYGVDVFAGAKPYHFDTSISGQFFNHIILCVPLENDTIWLENTSQISPFNYLGTFTQGRNVIIIDSAKSHIIKTPSISKEESLLDSRSEIVLNADKSESGKVVLRSKAGYFERLNSALKNYDDNDKKELIQSYLGLQNAEIEEWSIEKKDRDSKSISVHCTYTEKNTFKEIANKTVIYVDAIGIPSFENPEERIYDVQFNYPIFKVDTFVYDITALNKKDLNLPEDTDVSTEYGDFKIEFSGSDNMIVIRKEFYLKKGVIPVSEYEQFHAFVSESRKQDRKTRIILKDIEE